MPEFLAQNRAYATFLGTLWASRSSWNSTSDRTRTVASGCFYILEQRMEGLEESSRWIEATELDKRRRQGPRNFRQQSL